MSLGVPADLRWEEANNRYLKASLTWLRARLEAVAHSDRASDAPDTKDAPPQTGSARRRRRGRTPELPPAAVDLPDGGPGGSRRGRAPEPLTAVPDAGDLDALATTRQDAAAPSDLAPPALVRLAERFGLTDFERDVLLLVVAPAVDPGVGAAIAAAHGDPQATAPTFALALRLFDDARWDVLSPLRPLRRWRLAEVVPAPAGPLLTAPLRPDDRIANLVRGLNHLDERLTSVLEPVADPAAGVASPASVRRAEDAVVAAVLADTPDGRFPVVHLVGSDADSAVLVAVRAFARLERELYRLRTGLLVRGGQGQQDPDTVALLWHRESLLMPVALLLDGTDADPDDPALVAAVRRLLSRSGGPVVLAARQVSPVDGRSTAVVDVDVPPPDEQRALWAGRHRPGARRGAGRAGGAVPPGPARTAPGGHRPPARGPLRRRRRGPVVGGLPGRRPASPGVAGAAHRAPRSLGGPGAAGAADGGAAADGRSCAARRHRVWGLGLR
uniref:Winged helix domain-containing protein n=1 Tax=Streptomyces avermitilis TaxID=33903 RepID=A0A499V2Y4_STRAX|nr:hypothetical protein SAVMC3_04810 [Streptomyces avermitilis]